jgi:hypothetical protein
MQAALGRGIAVTTKKAVKTRAQWAAAIRARHKRFVEDFFGMGDDLIVARKQLDHGEFTKMIERDLPFGKRTAQILMKISADLRLRKANHDSLLPPLGWQTYHELTKLSDDELENALASGAINQGMTREQARSIRSTVTYSNVGGGRVTAYISDSAAKPPPNPVRHEEPTVARPRVAAADTDDPPMHLVATSTPPEPEAPPPDVASLALAQIERAVGDLAMAIERGDVRANAAFERRVKAVADRLLALVDDEHPAAIN